MRKNTVRNLTVKKKSFDEYQTGDKDPQQDVGEDGQEGSQQLNWAITRMENTYQLEPKTHFPHARAKQIIADELERTLEDVTYEPQECLRLATELSETLRMKQGVVGLNTDAYNSTEIDSRPA